MYSVLAFNVSQRVRELAIRQARGADARTIFREVVAGGARVIAAGIAVGLLATAGMTLYLRSVLFGIEPTDLATIGTACAVLAAAAFLASYLPARRAARVDAVAALKYE